MKVLWITWVMFPEVYALLNKKGNETSGGWLFGSAKALLDYGDVEISIAIVTSIVNDLTIIDGERLKYFLIPQVDSIHKYNNKYDSYWRRVTNVCCPDIIHVHGTESILGLSYIRACGNDNVIVSIQGLKGIIGRYYTHGLSRTSMIKNISLRDVIKKNTIFDAQRMFTSHYKYDDSYFKECKYFIGRTSWDKVHLWASNPDATYFFANETLRHEFYGYRWQYEKCKPHTIFLSQAKDSFKGFHQVIKALPLVMREFPDVEVRVAGKDMISSRSFKEKLKRTGYANIINELIRKYKLHNHIKFLGELSSEQMRDAYLDSNIFICSSAIENSSNSIGEAQILGMPLIATYVGGTPELIPSKEHGTLVRFEEYEMLAYEICKLFSNSILFNGEKMIKLANERHDRVMNVNRTLNIYHEVLKRKSTKSNQ